MEISSSRVDRYCIVDNNPSNTWPQEVMVSDYCGVRKCVSSVVLRRKILVAKTASRRFITPSGKSGSDVVGLRFRVVYGLRGARKVSAAAIAVRLRLARYSPAPGRDSAPHRSHDSPP
ncbi:hypothetical protein J6590_012405 [Homalodisca vitripennis]|nr:hypothetical protein J6590_012405 [Homalodisca vitripennis]